MAGGSSTGDRSPEEIISNPLLFPDPMEEKSSYMLTSIAGELRIHLTIPIMVETRDYDSIVKIRVCIITIYGNRVNNF